MLYWLLFLKLQHYVAPFRIFRYVTFRTAFASLTALFTALIVGPLVIGRLRDFQIGQYIREEGPKAHQKKAGTPPWAACSSSSPSSFLRSCGRT